MREKMAKKKKQNQPTKKQPFSKKQQEEAIDRKLANQNQKELDKRLAECAARRLARRRHIGIPTARLIIAARKHRNSR